MSTNLQRLASMAGITLTERKLTPAELKKREEVAKAIEKEDPGMDKSKKMAIATAQAKKMDEGESEPSVKEASTDLDESAREDKVAAHNKAVEGGYTVAMKKIAAKDPAVLKTAPAGYSFNVAHKLVKKELKEATGSNTPYDDIGAWKAAAAKAGLEVYSQGAADGKYTAKRDGEIYGRFNKEQGEGWIHSSAMKEAATYRGDVKAAYKAKTSVKEDEYQSTVGRQPTPLPPGLADIARTKLGFETLVMQNTGDDYQEVNAGAVRSALLAAYNLGKSMGATEATPAASQPQAGGLPIKPDTITPADHQQVAPVGR